MCGWKAKWTYKIGWITPAESNKEFVLIAMTDGMIGKGMTKNELTDRLNRDGMIPAPHKHMLDVIELTRGCYGDG